jgi:uncharacterized protein (TIGR03437 family)
MLTKLRIAPARFLPFTALACLVAVGCFDTAQAQDLTVSTSTLAFSTSPGVNPVNAQTVSIGSTGASFSFTISADASWISASTGLVPGNGTTGQTLTVQVTSSSLASGSYTGHITLTPDNGSPAVTITVNLDITGSGNTTYTLLPSLSNLYFAYELGQNVPAAQTIQISSTGIALPISITSSVTTSPNCPTGWLTFTASGTTTPAMITAAVVTTGLAAGTCGGKITVTSNTSGNGTTTTVIDVLVYISANAVLNIAIPVGLTNVTLLQGGDPVKFNIGLTSSDPNVALGFTATSTNAPWLAPPTPSSGATPASLYVQFTPGLVLAAGTYTASISISSSTIYGNPLVIPITFTLLPNNAVTISISGGQNNCTIASTVACTFSELENGSLPTAVTLNLTGTSSSSYTTSVTPGPVGGDWLQVSPAMGTIAPGAPGAVTMSVNTNSLPPFSYASVVTITFVPATIPAITIYVTLNVGEPAPALVASPPTVSFTYQSGGAVPGAQNVAISNASTGPSITYALASVSDTWLAVSPNGGATPGLVSVSVSPQSLQPGMYNGSFTLAASGGLTLTVPVSLAVSANQTPEPFIIANNSSNIGGQIAPGEIIFIKGSGLGPATGVVGVGTSLGGVQVTFNGTLATILYASASQLDVIVPYEVILQQTATMVVSYANASSSGIQLTVASAALGISTDNQAGTGQAAAQNQDYTLNSAANPALPGSYVSIYGTGGGQTNPASSDGEISPSGSLLPLVLQPYVTATIGGVPATVAFVGAAPGEITGVLQIDLQVPTGVSGLALPVVIMVNVNGTVIQSQAGVTIAVQ